MSIGLPEMFDEVSVVGEEAPVHPVDAVVGVQVRPPQLLHNSKLIFLNIL